MRPLLTASLVLLLAACAETAPPPAASPEPRAAPAPSAEETRTAAQRGAVVARRTCSFCHQVTPDRPAAVEAAAPSFMEIANLPGRSREYLREFATTRHLVETVEPKVEMPTVQLGPEEREDVIAYILAFQRDPATGRLPPVELEPFE